MHRVVLRLNEITNYSKWPRALPDPSKLAVEVHKKIQNQLFHVRFRDNKPLMSSLLIDYTPGDLDLKDVPRTVNARTVNGTGQMFRLLRPGAPSRGAGPLLRPPLVLHPSATTATRKPPPNKTGTNLPRLRLKPPSPA